MREMVFLTVMLTRNQHNRISLLAVFALLIGLFAAVPHYGHADASHGIWEHTQSFDVSVVDDATADNMMGNTTDSQTATECDHGCHLGHHFNGVLGSDQKSFVQNANLPPVSNIQKFSLKAKRRELRPPISQIS
jgi:hypothetical protein